MNFLTWWRAHSAEYQALLFDIDGTLISGKRLLPGANLLLNELRGNDFPFYLLTNDGNHSTEEKSRFMDKAGLQVSHTEIVSCAMALTQFVIDDHHEGKMFFVMGDLGKPCFAEAAGLRVCRDLARIYDCAGVIVGEGFYDWHTHISAVFNFLVKFPERPFVVPNPDSYWPGSKPGEFGIGAGGKARFICTILAEMGIAVKPIYLGKPYPMIYEYAVNLLHKRYRLAARLEPSRILMLGDSLQSDIKGANLAGMHSGLLLTGITTAAQAAQADVPLKPHFIFESLA